MASDIETLDVLEKKIKDLEMKVYGEKYDSSNNMNTIIDSLLRANTVMSAALSGREKFCAVFKRLLELNDYLELNPLSEDLTDLNTKLNIICFMSDELEGTIAQMEKINELKAVLDNDKIKNVQLLKDDLTELVAKHMTSKEKLDNINTEVSELLLQFNEICLEISKSFFLLNEAITKLETSK